VQAVTIRLTVGDFHGWSIVTMRPLWRYGVSDVGCMNTRTDARTDAQVIL